MRPELSRDHGNKVGISVLAKGGALLYLIGAGPVKTR